MSSKHNVKKRTLAAGRPTVPDGSYARLVFYDADGRAQQKDVLRHTTLIGSSRGCNLQLEAPGVSHAHCIITLEIGSLRVRDLRSAGGTRVNGTLVDNCTLIHSDRLRVGEFEFVVETNFGRNLAQMIDVFDANELILRRSFASNRPPSEGDGSRTGQDQQPQRVGRDEIPHREEPYARLVYKNPTDDVPGIRKDILRTTTLVGSDPGCNIELVAADVSSAHCVITLEFGVLRVRDLRAPVGTILNGSQIEIGALKDGDQLQIGSFVFFVETNLAVSTPQTPDTGRSVADSSDDQQDVHSEADRFITDHRRLKDVLQALERELTTVEDEKQNADRAAEELRLGLEELERNRTDIESERELLQGEQQRLDAESVQNREQRVHDEAEREDLNVLRVGLEAAREQLECEQTDVAQQSAVQQTTADALQRDQQKLAEASADIERERKEIDLTRDNLSTEYERVKRESDECAQSLAESQRQQKELDLEREVLQCDQRQLQQDHADIQVEVESARIAAQHLDREKDALEKARRTLDERSNQLAGTEAQLQEQQKTLSHENERLQNEHQQVADDTARLNSEWRELRENKQELHDLADDIQNDRRQFGEAQEDAQRAAESLNNAQQRFARSRDRFRQRIEQLRTRRHQLTEKRNQLSDDQRSHQQDILAFRKASEDLAQHEESVSRRHQDIEAHEQVYRNQQRELVGQQQELDSLSRQAQEDRDRISAQQQDLLQRTREVESDRDLIARREQELGAGAVDIARQSEDISKQSARLDVEQKALKVDRLQLQLDLERFQAEQTHIEQQITSFEVDCQRFETEKLNASELASELEQRGNDLEQQQAALEDGQSRLQADQQRLDEAQASLSGDRRLFDEQCESAKADATGWEQQRHEVEQQRRDLQSRFEQLQHERDTFGQKRETLNSEQELCRRKNVEVTESAAELIRQREQLQSELAFLQARSKQFEAGIQAFRAEERSLQERIAAFMSYRDRVQTPRAQSPFERLRPDAAETLVSHNVIDAVQADLLRSADVAEFDIDRYRVKYLLEVGRTGWLYKAHDVGADENIVLKILHAAGAADPHAVALFELEAQAASVAAGPHVLHTLGSFDADEAKCVVREFVIGANLQELTQLHIRTGWRDACNFVFQTAMGLEYIHQHGWVHGDIRPSNLIIDRHGRLKIVDLGQSLADGIDDMDTAAEAGGNGRHFSADYSAPEQTIRGERIDARADIYSLGCTFYFALTGSVPHPTSSVADRPGAHRLEPAEPVNRLAPHTPPSVANVVERMMAKMPQDRFQTAAELIEALAPFALQRPVHFDFQAILAARRAKVVQRLFHIAKRYWRHEERREEEVMI